MEDGVLALRNNLYSSVDYQELYNVIIVSLDDYNRLMGTRKTLESGQAMIYLTKNSSYPYESIRIEDGEMLQIVEREENFAAYQMSNKSQMLPTMYLFVEDIDRIAQQMRVIGNGDEDVLTWVRCYYGFDLNVSDEQQIEIYQQLEQQLQGGSFNLTCQSVAQERSSFYSLYGGLFFLGILFGIVFVFAAVLIIYYKQVSEGYEDRARFEILCKVGMTDREIRRSINSQVLTVFFMPLITAGVHLAFAFPLVYKILLLFGLSNLRLLIAVTVGAYLIFAVFYILVYRITSGSYYKIVSSRGERI